MKYPAECVASRFWIIHIFFEKMLPELRKCAKMVDDFVDFLVPHLSACPEFKCNASEEHSKQLCNFLMTKFFRACLRTKEKKMNMLSEYKPIVNNKPQKRKVLKLQK